MPTPTINYRNDATLQIDATRIRNVVQAGSGTIPAIITESFTANGTDIYWPLSYVPDTTWLPPTMTAANVVRPLTDGNGGAYGIAPLAPDRSSLTTGTDGVPTNGTVLTITYAYDVPVLVELVDATSIGRVAALPSWGRYGYQPINAGPTFAQAASDVSGVLGLWAAPILRARVTVTEESTTQGIAEAQSIQFVSNRLGVSLTMVVGQIGYQGSPAGASGGKIIPLVLAAQG